MTHTATPKTDEALSRDPTQEAKLDELAAAVQAALVAANNAAAWFVMDPQGLVGERIEVLWKWWNGGVPTYFTGTVTEYDSVDGTHRVEYDDGDVRTYILTDQAIRVPRPDGKAIDTFTKESHEEYFEFKKNATSTW